MPADPLVRVRAQQARSRATLERILISAGNIFDEVGFEAGTMEAIAIRAEVSTMTGTLATEAEWSLATASADAPLPLIGCTLEDPLAILYTGGTTGKPKGIVLTQRNLYRSVADMMRVFPLSPADRILSVLPLCHVMPLLANLLAPL